MPDRIFKVLRREVSHILPAVIYFFCAFNLIVFTTNLVTGQYWRLLSGFGIATTAALLVGKAVLVADKLPIIERFRNAPLIKPILFKTVFYTLIVFVVRLAEVLLRTAFKAGGLNAAFRAKLEKTPWHLFAAVQIWILTCFLIYVTARELVQVAGAGEVHHLFFRARPSDWQLTRRQHVKALLEISRLAHATAPEKSLDPTTPAGAKMLELLASLRRRRSPVKASGG